jgi:6-pyruvoyltetrahydropterin/6-carboxytetrahydropterin synthase
VIRLTRKYRLSASHRLHSPQLSEEVNQELYGKCNNPFGHGHNYEIEVSVRGPVDPRSGRGVDCLVLDRLVRDEVLTPLHNRNLNSEVPEFASVVPTTENLGIVIHRRLREKWRTVFPDEWPALEKVRIAETERNIFEVRT